LRGVHGRDRNLIWIYLYKSVPITTKPASSILTAPVSRLTLYDRVNINKMLLKVTLRFKLIYLLWNHWCNFS